jgi:hypothetical protein
MSILKNYAIEYRDRTDMILTTQNAAAYLSKVSHDTPALNDYERRILDDGPHVLKALEEHPEHHKLYKEKLEIVNKKRERSQNVSLYKVDSVPGVSDELANKIVADQNDGFTKYNNHVLDEMKSAAFIDELIRVESAERPPRSSFLKSYILW